MADNPIVAPYNIIDVYREFPDDLMIIVKAVAKCDPHIEYLEETSVFFSGCFFCGNGVDDKPEHTDDCPYILARKIIKE